MIGYLMTLDNSLKKAFMVYGQQDSGKTQNLLIINHIIGEENIARIELQRLDSDQFGTDGLEFRMVCEDDDLPKDRLKGASKCKTICLVESIDSLSTTMTSSGKRLRRTRDKRHFLSLST